MPNGKKLKRESPKVIAEALAYLRSQVTAVVSTVSTQNMPEAATVFYWIDETGSNRFNVYFITHRHSRKFANLLNNHHVAIVVGAAFEPRTMQIEGEAELVDVGDGIKNMTHLAKRLAKKPAMSMLYAGYFSPKNPFGKLPGTDMGVFRVRVTWARFMTHAKETKDIHFHQIVK